MFFIQMYRPSERGVKNELVVHCVVAVLPLTSSHQLELSGSLTSDIALCGQYEVQTGIWRVCGPRLVPLEHDTTAIDILRVVTGVTQYLSHTEVISTRRSSQTVDLHRFR